MLRIKNKKIKFLLTRIDKSKIFLINLLLLLMVIPSNASFISPNNSGYDLDLKLDPEYPSANQTISARVELYGLDIEKYEIIWSIDGVVKERGIGQKEFFFQTKDCGDSTVLTVQINTTNNGQIKEQFQIVPAEVDLIWEADTYVHPFYKGRSMNSSNSIINVVAIPNFVNKNGQKIDAEKLIYNWKEDWKVKGGHSGYGKNTFSLEGPQTSRSKNIIVEVESLDGSIKAEASVNLRANSPEIIFYQQDPLLGTLYNRAIKNEYNLVNEEVKIKASPFFFSPQNATKYNWTMNGKVMDITDNEITFRQSGNQGSSEISLKIQNLDSILQYTKNKFLIKFGE